MTMNNNNTKQNISLEEKAAPAVSGILMLILNIVLSCASIVLIFAGVGSLGAAAIIIGSLYLAVAAPILLCGLKILKPNEAYVLTLFGNYHGTLKGPGYFFVNPFVSATNPGSKDATTANFSSDSAITVSAKPNDTSVHYTKSNKKLSLKTMTLNNDKQKINDQLGNPIIIGIVVIWKVVNTAKAVFNVDNYTEFLSIQCDSALRDIVSLYPYDNSFEDNNDEKSLRGSSQEIAGKLAERIQSKVEIAGLEVVEARITHLAYAPEIAAAMLQRQQASAVVDARQMIVEGAVGMVEMALDKLNDKDIVHLDEERKAAMVSNLLVVLCGNKDAQPVVNSGSLY